MAEAVASGLPVNGDRGARQGSETLPAVLRRRAAHQAERVAYRYLADGESETAMLTYAALDERARAVASAMQAIAERGDRALLLYPPGLEFVEAFFGCLHAALIAVPAYPPSGRKASMQRLVGIARDSGATVAMTTAALLPSLSALAAETPGLERLRWIATDAVGSEHAARWSPTAPSADDLALLQYTSGSTGTPKGVMVTHGNLVSNSLIIQEGFELTPDSVSVTWLPSFHDMGLVDGILQPVFTGFLGVVMPPAAFLQRPARWLEAISRYGGTHAGGPNFAYDLLARRVTAEERSRLRLHTWLSAYNGAEPVSADVIELFAATFAEAGFQARFSYPCYGLAEGTLMVTGSDMAAPPVIVRVDADALRGGAVRIVSDESEARDTRPLVSSGHPWRDTRVAIVDPDTGRALGEREVGEIWASGSTIAAGYWNRPEETDAVFGGRIAASGEGPFLRSGDLGFVHDGQLFVAGRIKDLIIIRGRNHYPQDIETTVGRCHAALRPGCGAAFGLEIDGEERLVVAHEVDRQALARLDADAVFAAVRRALAEEHDVLVERVILLKTATVPKTSSGKIQRSRCRAMYLAGELTIVAESTAPAPSVSVDSERTTEAHATPADVATVRWLRERVAALLDTLPERISSHEPLAQYGLDSLRAVILSGEIAGRLGVGREVPPTIVYDHPSIDALARYMAGGSESDKAAAAQSPGEPLAIVGMSARFPGAPNLDAFWELIRTGGDGVRAVPDARRGWASPFDDLPAPSRGAERAGFIDGIDQFDAELFGITPREADAIDPQQRLLLEGAWEALEHACIAPTRLAGSRTGVFVGISSQDYFRRQERHAPAELYTGTGNALSVAANRISYVFDLRGPSMAVDTACSSSLAALHLAAGSLRRRECDTALVGGVNALLDPALTAAFANAGMLASDGRCKTFDASADGYVRGEGCGVIVLKRLVDAARDGDRILAVVRGTAVNQDGRSNGLTAPNGAAQEAVIAAALRDGGVSPADVRYVEAHGTGTALGDPIETGALERALGDGRGQGQPCYIGSVKANLGHLEAAAGIAGLIKVVLMLREGVVPPHANFRELNPAIRLAGTRFEISKKDTVFAHGRRIAGVSAFGFGGTNAHAVLEAAPSVAVVAGRATGEGELHLALVSARTRPALAGAAARLAAHLRVHPELPLAGVCATLAHGRAELPERLAIVCSTLDELAGQLEAFAANGASRHAGRVRADAESAPPGA
ncbi:MAG TPA: beta-ketoacyl synthase N-terminal-like domain-containing protein, partial [Gemmatimonadaceae bacterium]|nr:beta-ketoacyl synthase N-terminal-like domain-containing protein [Gemmatimonadaceae bacterium]